MRRKAASDKPLPELAEYLSPFSKYFVRSEGRESLERYSTGLLTDIPRKNRTTIAYPPGHFINVNNLLPFYTVTIGLLTDPTLYGLLPDQIFELHLENKDGLVYVPVPPSSYNAIISVEPRNVEGVVPMTFTSQEFHESYAESLDQGYFREHNFALTGDTSEPEPTPEPRPSPSPTPKPKSPGGIPGFPLESLVLGIAIVSGLYWMTRKRY